MFVKRGSTMVLVVVILAAILTVTAFLVDAAAAYITQARLYNLADAGADAGSATLTDLILGQALIREPNPPDGADPINYLTEEDRQAILADPRVVEAARNYVEQNRAPYNLNLSAVEVQYPVQPVICGAGGQRQAEILVMVRRTQSFLLSRLLNGRESTGLAAEARQFISLCPVS